MRAPSLPRNPNNVPISPTFHLTEAHLDGQWWRILVPPTLPMWHLRGELRAQAHSWYFTSITTRHTAIGELCFRLG
jgi:hypothetical protein